MIRCARNDAEISLHQEQITKFFSAEPMAQSSQHLLISSPTTSTTGGTRAMAKRKPAQARRHSWAGSPFIQEPGLSRGLPGRQFNFPEYQTKLIQKLRRTNSTAVLMADNWPCEHAWVRAHEAQPHRDSSRAQFHAAVGARLAGDHRNIRVRLIATGAHHLDAPYQV